MPTEAAAVGGGSANLSILRTIPYMRSSSAPYSVAFACMYELSGLRFYIYPHT